ncbi:MAG: ComF family protein [Rhizobiaceae bacterium]
MADRRDPFSLTAKLQQITSFVLNTLVPPSCLACDTAVASGGHLCGNCWSRLRIIEQPFCPIMGTPFAYDPGGVAGGVCEVTSLAVIAEPPTFDRSRSAVVYDDVARRLVHGLKFSDRVDLAPWMAKWMVRAGKDILAPEAIVIPVPLHRWRMIRRRYNQSAELGRYVAKLSRIDFHPSVLQRIRPTRQQVGLGAKERQRNVLGAFRVSPEMVIRVRSRHIVLVDDVYTTGATLQACARTLRRKGAAKVDCLTFARVVGGVAKSDL